MRRFTVPIVAVALVAVGTSFVFAQGRSNDYLVHVNGKGVILEGYDTVALFTDRKPVQGNSKFSTTHNGATYWFTSNRNKDLFSASPEKYQPQFGAYCAMSMTMGKLVKGDVRTWSIVGGRLVVQANEKAARMWSKDAKGHLKKADGNWATVVAKHKKKG